jgi:hypothetical protein
MIDHPAHVRNAKLALAHADATGDHSAASDALRVLLYEPADEFQGWFIDRAEVAR